MFIIVILALQAVATYFYWYWRIWWFDMPMHFAGGLWIGLSMLWLIFSSGRIHWTMKRDTRSIFVTGILSVLAIAVLWEIFEYGVDVLFPRGTPYDMYDTLSDIFWGVCGGAVASFSFSQKRYTN